MARIKLMLDLAPPAHQRILIHGQSNAGKTFLAGAAMAEAQKAGRPVYFIDTKGEEGTQSIAGFGLGGDVAETVENFADLEEVLKEQTPLLKENGLLCIDSMYFVWRFVNMHILKSDRSPVISKTSTDWQDLYRTYDGLLAKIISTSRDLIVLCPSDVSNDQVEATMKVTPDLPGKKIASTVAAFDMVGFLQNSAIGSTSRRILNFQGMPGVTTKIRAGKKEMKGGIKLESGNKVWEEVQKVLDEHV